MAVKKKAPPKKRAPIPPKKTPGKKTIPGKRRISGQKANSGKLKKPAMTREFKKILVGMAVLVSICLTGAMIADLLFHPGRSQKKETVQKARPKTQQTQKQKPRQEDRVEPVTGIMPISEDMGEPVNQSRKKPFSGLKAKSGKGITYEVFEDIEPIIVERPVLPTKEDMPRIAVIIDDIGYDKKTALALCELNPNITFSVLPFAPFGRYISDRLRAKGAQLMLHLPMEPVDYPHINPGPGAILSAMSADVLLDQLKKNINDIPYIVGVNNHMGSELTTHSDQMNQIFTILKKRDLFFVDSRTAAQSQCRASARLLKIKFAQRDVFLDNVQDIKYITGQFRELIQLAEKHGSAIGIGHPYKATLKTLARELPKLKNRVNIVRTSSLTAIPG
jgi:hypothetical protein